MGTVKAPETFSSQSVRGVSGALLDHVSWVPLVSPSVMGWEDGGGVGVKGRCRCEPVSELSEKFSSHTSRASHRGT